MSSTFGEILKVTTFGESHGNGVGVVVDNFPAGIEVDEVVIQQELNRRRPGTSRFVSPRDEADRVEILSGVSEGKTIGSPVAMLVRNTNQRSKDYGDLLEKFRPGHADFGYFQKYGIHPQPGGGRASGRETIGRVAAGALARLLLKDIQITSLVTRIGTVVSQKHDFDFADGHPLRFADPSLAALAAQEVDNARMNMDSVGGTVLLQAHGVPAGLGEPVFDKLDARLGGALFSIGGVKAVEIGSGCECAAMRGSEFNDRITEPGTEWPTNHGGGIMGGISTGQPVLVKIHVKPTPSIASDQKTIRIDGKESDIQVKGRHDPCLCPRVAVVCEAMLALVLADMLLLHRSRYF